MPPTLPETSSAAQPAGADAASDLAQVRVEMLADETLILRILATLYLSKKRNLIGYAISIIDLEKKLDLPREGATFVCDYMKYRRLVLADDKSRFTITVEGIDYLRRGLQIEEAPLLAPLT
ncbi:MAG: hypothetical protein ACK58M_11590 [Acidobacteriota bacterium]|jgi:hypothetical protein|nr:hypothetical protein [Bryobacteraceae bacterium CoA2 C42]MCA2964767.1 hypothetical protein [Acidobacteriaceae bacterium]